MLFAPLILFPAHKFTEQMGTKGTRKFRFSAPQTVVYDACNCATPHGYHLETLWCIPGGHNNKGGEKKKQWDKNETSSAILIYTSNSVWVLHLKHSSE